MKSYLTGAIVAIALAQNAVAADPAFNVTGTWQPAGGGKASFFQNKLKDNDLTIINITDNFAHLYVGSYWETDGKWHGTQTRVNRTDGCTTKMRLIVTATSSDSVSVWAKALDTNCDLTKGQTFTDTVTRIQ